MDNKKVTIIVLIGVFLLGVGALLIYLKSVKNKAELQATNAAEYQAQETKPMTLADLVTGFGGFFLESIQKKKKAKEDAEKLANQTGSTTVVLPFDDSGNA